MANAAKSKLRRQRSRPFIFSLDELGPEHEEIRLADMLADPRTNLDEEYARVEEIRILASILDELPSALRVVVLLCDIEGLKVKEAAAQLGMTISAVKTRHFRANRLLMKMAKKAGAHPKSNNDSEKPVRQLRHPPRRGVGSANPMKLEDQDR